MIDLEIERYDNVFYFFMCLALMTMTKREIDYR